MITQLRQTLARLGRPEFARDRLNIEDAIKVLEGNQSLSEDIRRLEADNADLQLRIDNIVQQVEDRRHGTSRDQH